MGVGRVSRHTPEIMIVEPVIRSIPRVASVVALYEAIPRTHKTIACRRIQPVGREPVHHQRVCIKWSVSPAILPGLASIQAPYQRARLRCSEDAAGHQWIRRNPADM